MKHWTNTLERLGACEDAVEWARAYQTPAEAWEACERPDWIAWLVMRVSGPFGSASHRRASKIIGRIAATFPALECERADSRRLEALALVERYGNGEAVTRDALERAENNAYRVQYSAASLCASDAADAARDTAAHDAAAFASFAVWRAAGHIDNARLLKILRDEYTAAEVEAMAKGTLT